MPDTLPDITPEDLAWLEALNTLSSRARTAAAGEEQEPWTPPADAGPLPPRLVPLAQSIIGDQARAIEALQTQMADIRSRDKVVRGAGYGGENAPVYFDQVG